MKFVKGQWYTDGEYYFQYHDIECIDPYFRMAGSKLSLPYGQPVKHP